MVIYQNINEIKTKTKNTEKMDRVRFLLLFGFSANIFYIQYSVLVPNFVSTGAQLLFISIISCSRCTFCVEHCLYVLPLHHKYMLLNVHFAGNLWTISNVSVVLVCIKCVRVFRKKVDKECKKNIKSSELRETEVIINNKNVQITHDEPYKMRFDCHSYVFNPWQSM